MSELRFLGKKNILGFDVGEQSVTKFVKQRTKRDQIEFKLLLSLLSAKSDCFYREIRRGQESNLRSPRAMEYRNEEYTLGTDRPSEVRNLVRFDTELVLEVDRPFPCRRKTVNR
jgi:hypothetical protein